MGIPIAPGHPPRATANASSPISSSASPSWASPSKIRESETLPFDYPDSDNDGTPDPGAPGTVLGFGAVHIDGSYGGSQKFVELHMITGLKAPDSTSGGPGGGPNYGAITNPKLAY